MPQVKLLPEAHTSRIFLEVIPLVTSVLTSLISIAQGSWCFFSVFISRCPEVEITRINLTSRGLLFPSVHWGVCACSVVSNFVTPWTKACQVPLSKEFSRQKYWSGLSFPSSGDLADPGIKPASPSLAGEFFTTSTWEALCPLDVNIINGDPEETGWDDWEIQAFWLWWKVDTHCLHPSWDAAVGNAQAGCFRNGTFVCYFSSLWRVLFSVLCAILHNTLSSILVVISHQMNRGFP